MAVLRMAQHNNANIINSNNIASQQQKQQLVKKPMFHDFFGMNQNPIDSNALYAPKSASHVHVTSSSFSSTTSDLPSERQTGNHLEGVPFYGLRSESSGIEIGNRLVGNKRSNSDSTFMVSSRDAFHVVHDSLKNSHLMKILRNVAGGNRLRRPNEDQLFLGMQSLKPTCGSQILQPPVGTKIDSNKWEQSIFTSAYPSMQHPPHGGQLTPSMHRITSNKMRDASAGPSFISQSAADEGSRTGIKGPGILSSINTINAANEKASSVLGGGSRPKPVTNIVEPESSTILNRHRPSSTTSCQMTIFYGGQAHVFDDVQPNKADVIMALAGSNGGSWSTTFSPKSSAKLLHDSNLLNGENETVIASNVALPPDLHGRLSITSSSSHAVGPGDRVTTPTVEGAYQGSIIAKDARNLAQAANPSSEDNRAQ